jgi:hypothetical protein
LNSFLCRKPYRGVRQLGRYQRFLMALATSI